MSLFRITATQINTKRQWPNAINRIKRMLAQAEEAGSTIVTLNEISRDQAHVIKNLPGWDIYWVINDNLRKNNWAGNAVAWKISEWSLQESFPQPVEIDYRRGLKRARLGPWYKRTIKFACVTLNSTRQSDFNVAVQAFHYPTKFGSNDKSRNTCSAKSGAYATRHIEKNQAVILGGDGNGASPRVPNLAIMDREGPDLIASNGKKRRSMVLYFKKSRLTDHNGILVTVEFKLD